MVAFLGLFGFTIGAKPDLYNLFVMPFVDGEAFQYNLGSWFVYPLFLVCIINVLFRKFLKLIHLDNEFIVLIVYLAIGMIGINTAIENPTAINGIVKLFVRTMFFLPCYEFGRFFLRFWFQKTDARLLLSDFTLRPLSRAATYSVIQYRSFLWLYCKHLLPVCLR